MKVDENLSKLASFVALALDTICKTKLMLSATLSMSNSTLLIPYMLKIWSELEPDQNLFTVGIRSKSKTIGALPTVLPNHWRN